MLEKLYDYFIADSLREVLADHYRARILVAVSFFGSLVLAPFVVARFLLQGTHPYPALLVLTIACILASPWIMKARTSVAAGGVFLTISSLIGFSVLAVVDGGTLSPTVFALPLLPLFGIFFHSLKAGFIMMGITAVLLIVLATLTVTGHVLPGPLPPEIHPWVEAASALSLTIVLMAMAYLFMEWQRVARERLTTASSAKDSFLSGMSHELRTPLNSVMGFTEVLMQEYVGPLNEKQKQNLGYIYQGSEHLLQLVEDLVNVTNLEADKVQLTLAEVNLRELVTFCLTSLRERAADKDINFVADFGDAPESVTGDETRLRQILLNILSNALKFSPEGELISVTLNLNGPIVEIRIRDAGPGIPPEHQNQVFEKFFQVNSDLSGKTVGSGLGLYIARRLAELHGGRLQLTDVEQPGSTFVLILPVKGT